MNVTANLPPTVLKNLSTMRDPRRTVVMFHTNSPGNPRSKKWYRIAEVCEFEGQLFLHRDCIKPANDTRDGWPAPNNRAEAVLLAKTCAAETGNPYVPGIWSGQPGQPLKRA